MYNIVVIAPMWGAIMEPEGMAHPLLRRAVEHVHRRMEMGAEQLETKRCS